jgi:hypothetical protein
LVQRGLLTRQSTENQGRQRVAAALLQNVSPEAVLELVCTEVPHLTGATGSALLFVEDPIWLRLAYSSALEYTRRSRSQANAD